MTRDALSYCRICAAACGIVVTVDGDRVVRVRGDEEHPVSRGYTCTKGRGLAAWHHAPDRLDRPRLRGRDVSWDELLTDLGTRLDAIIGDSGPDAIALYLATGLAYDAAGQIAAAQWLPSIGSSSFLTAVTVDNAPALVAAELVAGQPMLNPVWDPTSARVTVFVGSNPVVSHGYGTALPDPVRRIRENRASGGSVWVLDPRRTETAALADVHIPVLPGSDVVVLGALANALVADGPDELRAALAEFTVERAARVADVEPASLERLIAELRDARGHIAMHCGTGVTMARDGVIAEWLRWVVLIASGSLDRPGGMVFHRGVINPMRRRSRRAAPTAGPASRPELPRVVGQLPAVALVDEIEAGNIRALVVTGGNPLTAFPQPDRLRAALASLDVLAVVDVAANQLTAMATHILPATGQLERADVTLAEPTALQAGLQYTPAVVAPVGERRPVWWMFAALNRAMGRDAVPLDLTDEQFLRGVLARTSLGADAVVAAGPRGVATTVEYGWVQDELLPDGRWNIAPPEMLERLAAYRDPERSALALAPRRVMAWSNSIRYGAERDDAVVRMHPDAAPGPVVALASEHGEVTATCIADPTVRPGVASMTHGHLHESPGRLTSDTIDVDPLTAMPHVSGLPVRGSTP